MSKGLTVYGVKVGTSHFLNPWWSSSQRHKDSMIYTQISSVVNSVCQILFVHNYFLGSNIMIILKLYIEQCGDTAVLWAKFKKKINELDWDVPDILISWISAILWGGDELSITVSCWRKVWLQLPVLLPALTSLCPWRVAPQSHPGFEQSPTLQNYTKNGPTN